MNSQTSTNTGADGDALARALETLSAPVSTDRPLWQAALHRCTPTPVPTHRHGGAFALFQSAVKKPVWSLAALVAIGGIAVAAAFQTVNGPARMNAVDSRTAAYDSPAPSAEMQVSETAARGGDGESRLARHAGAPFSSSPAERDRASAPLDSLHPRLVARKASIDLRTDDVAGIFSKVSFLLSEAGGEYVENSALTGTAERAGATLTLRVHAERLSQVLNELRKLGEVASETSSGDDVTDRAVDLDSRIRNEERVEKELLELLDKRPDAPLKEILELRDSLARVRGSIEVMRAQRDRLSNLVSLATVLVSIRHSAEESPDDSGGMWTYVSERFDRTISGATRALVDSVLWIVGALVAGAVWWLILAGAVIGVLALRRRQIRARAAEPAPRLA